MFDLFQKFLLKYLCALLFKHLYINTRSLNTRISLREASLVDEDVVLHDRISFSILEVFDVCSSLNTRLRV